MKNTKYNVYKNIHTGKYFSTACYNWRNGTGIYKDTSNIERANRYGDLIDSNIDLNIYERKLFKNEYIKSQRKLKLDKLRSL